MIADVVFDLPLRRSFSYAVPSGMKIARGQRVRAPLKGRSRVGVAVAVRYGDEGRLKSIEAAVESVPVLSATALDVAGWAAEESFSSWGSTLFALLPPPARRGGEVVAPPGEMRPARSATPELWVGKSREARLVERLQDAGSALVIAPDRERAARWAERLDAVRLDSGALDTARRAAWFAAARGRARIAVGTRSALLAPLPPPATLVLLDEHEAAHKPPGAPRLHSRDLLIRRAELDGSALLLLSATPSAESWWRALGQHAIRPSREPEPWPEIIAADPRPVLRNHPLTLPLTRLIEEATRRGRRVALIVTRRAPALVCNECGALLRCAECGVPLAFSRTGRALRCRLCGRSEAAPECCAHCGGHRLSPLGWDVERVEAAVARRFPKLTVSSADPNAHVVVGTPAALGTRASGFGGVGIVSLDSILGAPDFRGGERAFALCWAAAEAVVPDGRVVIQTLHATHEAIQAVKAQDLAAFYERELKARADFGYPPFRRLCVVSVRGASDAQGRILAAECRSALSAIAGLTVYPPALLGVPGARTARFRLAIKGPAELPRLIAPALAPFLERPRRGGDIVEIEMDPVA
jgi:primosomal protein N'